MSKDSLILTSNITSVLSENSTVTKELILESKITTELALSSYIGIEIADLPKYCPEFQAVYDAWAIKPLDAVAAEMDKMVCGWVDSGVWAKKDRIFVFAIHTNDNGEALIDWKNPTTNFSTLVNDPLFTPFEGFTGDGVTQHIDSNFNPALNGINFTLDGNGVSVYTRTDKGTGALFGALAIDSVSYLYLFPYYVSTGSIIRDNGTKTAFSGAVTKTSGMHQINRVSNDRINHYNNNSLLIDDLPNSSTSIVDRDVSILRYPGIYYDGQVSMFGIGGKLTEQEIISETNYLEEYMISNGKGVI